MTKFNQKNTIHGEVERMSDATTNFEGGIAFNVSPKMELFLRTASAMVGEPKFYVDGETSDRKLIELASRVAAEDPVFVYKLALYTRDKLYLRSVPVMLLTEIANTPVGQGVANGSRYVTSTIQRADEITEMISYQLKINESKKNARAYLPMVLKKGMRNAFNKFDRYQMGKYSGVGNTVSLKDAMCLVHPLPYNEVQADLFENVINGKITNESYNVHLMINGSSKENYESEIPRMGYMSLLRNINNFLKNGVDVDLYMDRIIDAREVKKSKQFPYRFFTAWNMVKTNKDAKNPSDVSIVLKGLESSLKTSVDNIPCLDGITFTAVDVSGSMDICVSEHSVVRRVDVSALFGAIMNHISNKSIVSAFAEGFAVVPMDSDAILKNMENVTKVNIGCSTNGWKAIDYLNRNKIVVDRIVTFSDEVLYDSTVRKSGIFGFDVTSHRRQYVDEILKYQRNVNPDVYVYSVDLAGYGFSSLPEGAKNTVKIAGFSEKIFNYIELFERDRTTMLNDIENYTYH
jgi:hypothetical protein